MCGSVAGFALTSGPATCTTPRLSASVIAPPRITSTLSTGPPACRQAYPCGRLNATSVTPIDREDIHALATALDDIVDYAEEAADFLGLYKIEAPMEQAQQQTGTLRDACRNVAGALEHLHHMRGADIQHFIVEVHRLENEGDRMVQAAVASLFEGGVDPMAVIRWKDLFERIEQAIDSCEHAANIIEGIAIKHAYGRPAGRFAPHRTLPAASAMSPRFCPDPSAGLAATKSTLATEGGSR